MGRRISGEGVFMLLVAWIDGRGGGGDQGMGDDEKGGETSGARGGKNISILLNLQATTCSLLIFHST